MTEEPAPERRRRQVERPEATIDGVENTLNLLRLYCADGDLQTMADQDLDQILDAIQFDLLTDRELVELQHKRMNQAFDLLVDALMDESDRRKAADHGGQDNANG